MGAAHRLTRGRGMILEDVLKRTDSMVTVEARHWAWAPFLGEVRTASNDDRRASRSDRGRFNTQVDLLGGQNSYYLCVVAPRFGSRMAVARLVPYVEVQEWPVKELRRGGSASRNFPIERFLESYFTRPPRLSRGAARGRFLRSRSPSKLAKTPSCVPSLRSLYRTSWSAEHRASEVEGVRSGYSGRSS